MKKLLEGLFNFLGSLGRTVFEKSTSGRRIREKFEGGRGEGRRLLFVWGWQQEAFKRRFSGKIVYFEGELEQMVGGIIARNINGNITSFYIGLIILKC